MINVKKNLTGQIFGRLTVICQVDDHITSTGIHRAKWLCECSCEEHKTVEVIGARLTTKKKPTRSCGCLQREAILKTINKYIKKINIYTDVKTDEYGAYYIGYCSNTNSEFYVDAEDYEKIKNYCWSEHHPSDGFSVLTTFDPDSGKHIKMHQLLGFSWCDHIDRNELNNRKYNLRTCTQQENCQNKSKRRDNTSGVVGVSWNQQHNKWYAELKKGNIRWRRSFDNFDDAVKARLQAELQYFGEFAPQKHLYDEYGITNIQ